jgi:hypothetical protein
MQVRPLEQVERYLRTSPLEMGVCVCGFVRQDRRPGLRRLGRQNCYLFSTATLRRWEEHCQSHTKREMLLRAIALSTLCSSLSVTFRGTRRPPLNEVPTLPGSVRLSNILASLKDFFST